jgi:hypothetical protein
MYPLGGIVYVEVATHNKRPIGDDIEGILQGFAILVQDDGIAQFKDGPVIRRQVLWHGLDNTRFLLPQDSVCIFRLHAGCRRPSSIPAHDGAVCGLMRGVISSFAARKTGKPGFVVCA